MTFLAQAMFWLFNAAWCVGIAGHVYGTRFFIARWAKGFRKRPQHEGYGRKIAIGYSVFIISIAICFAAGGIAQLAGGWE